VPPGGSLTVTHNLNDTGVLANAWAQDLSGTWKSLNMGRVRVTGADTLDDSILAYWKFEETQPSPIIDSGRLGLVATGSATTSTPGKFGSGIQISGTSFQVNAPQAAGLAGGKTIGAWIWLDSWGPSVGVGIFAAGSAAGYSAAGFSGDSTGRTQCQFGYSNNQQKSTVPDFWFGLASWHHVACVVTETEGRLFVDGELKSSVTLSSPNAMDGRLYIVTTPLLPGGRLDELFISSKSMTGADLLAVMTNGVTGYGAETLTAFRVEQPDANTAVLYNDTPRTLPMRLEVIK
jgi:hypothetical protein